MGVLDKLVVCTVAVALVVAGCGEDIAPAAVSPDPASVAPAATLTATDGVVSEDEAARASDVVRANDIASELLDRYGGHLTPWEPAELEGEPRGAVALIELTEPISMSPIVLRPRVGSEPTRVEDYVLVTEQLGNQMVETYGVWVDLVTMTVVHLAPTAAPPPVTTAPESD